MGSPEFISINDEWPAQLEELRLVISDPDVPFKDGFERGVAITEELDRVYSNLDPTSPAPTPETETLRSTVLSLLSGSNFLQRLELGQILTAEFEHIRQAISPPTPVYESEVSDGRRLTYDEYALLRVITGVGTQQAWSHGWNRARALGLLDDHQELALTRLETKLAHWLNFRPSGVGKATLRVYLAVVESTHQV